MKKLKWNKSWQDEYWQMNKGIIDHILHVTAVLHQSWRVATWRCQNLFFPFLSRLTSPGAVPSFSGCRGCCTYGRSRKFGGKRFSLSWTERETMCRLHSPACWELKPSGAIALEHWNHSHAVYFPRRFARLFKGSCNCPQYITIAAGMVLNLLVKSSI